MENLVQSLGKLMTPDVLSQLSGMVGGSSSATAKAMSAIGPTLVGALSKAGSSPDGAKNILNMLNSTGADGSNLTNVAGLLSNPDSLAKMTDAAGPMLDSLLGSNASGITNAVSSFSGLNSESIGQLMKVGAPLLAGVVGKAVKSGNLDASGLSSLLGGQKGFVKQAMPNGLDIDQMLGKTPAAAKQATKAAAAPARKIPWLWIALGALALLVVGYLIFTSLNGGATADTATVSGTVTKLDRSALPEDAVITVQVQDTSRADAPAVVLGEQVINAGGQQAPYAFSIAYDPADIEDSGRYTMSARIEDGDGELLYINDTSIPVITDGSPTENVEVMVVAAN